MSLILNDVHSRLNATNVLRVHRPQNLEELVSTIAEARREGRRISVAGGRHAMGGQQFGSGSVHVDMTALNRVLNFDPVKGLLEIEAGADWPAIVDAIRGMPANADRGWSIRQKQTGVDAVTLGGSISANAHGRGLDMEPIGGDIENATLVTADSEVLFCSREENAELFSLVIGGYGLFGIIYSATLRLMPRFRMERLVDIIDLDDAMNAVFRRADDGCLFGDFQFVIDPDDTRFLRRGVFSCYRPVEPGEADDVAGHGHADLTPESWLNLLKLAHEDKTRAFRLYAQHYLSTDGNRYWSDLMQFATYLPSYADFLESFRAPAAGPTTKESLVIGEHYVPRDRLLTFIGDARKILHTFGTEVIYGTIRAIRRDTVSFLPWARDDYACIIFNLRTPHSPEGIHKTAETFRALIDAAIAVGGSFFLTYHRHATTRQIESCYPRFRNWLDLKRRYDPKEALISDWYLHYRDAFARA